MPRRRLSLLSLAVAPLVLAACGGPAFEPTGPVAATARGRAVAAEVDLLDSVAPGAEVIGAAAFDACSEGQDNWKVHDTNRHECVVARSRVVAGARTADDVDSSLRAVHAALVGRGCRPLGARAGLDRVADEYWPSRREASDSSPGMLPSGRYDCGPSGGLGEQTAVQVEVQPYAGGADEEYDLRPDVSLTRYHADPVLVAEPFAADTRARVAASDLALHYVVTAQVTYYAVPF